MEKNVIDTREMLNKDKWGIYLQIDATLGLNISSVCLISKDHTVDV